MKYTEVIPEKDGRKLSLNTCDWNGNECREMQISIMDNEGSEFIDISKDEARRLRGKLNEWVD